MNGKERNLSLFRKLSAYIMQDNQLHANLTVEEAMNVAANLKLSQKVQRSEKLNVVSVIILMIRLFEVKIHRLLEFAVILVEKIFKFCLV